MKKLLAIMLCALAFTGCAKKDDDVRQVAVEHVEDQYIRDYPMDVKEIDHDQKGRGKVRCFLIDVNVANGKEIHHWCVYVDVLSNGEIWQIDADKWVYKK